MVNGFFDSPQNYVLTNAGVVNFHGFVAGDLNLNWAPALSTAIAKTNGDRHARPQAVTLALPEIDAFPGDTLKIPLQLSTGHALSFIQIALETDSTVVQFIGAQPGENAAGMNLLVNRLLPFPAQMNDTNQNIVLQLSSAATELSGQEQESIELHFLVKGTAGTTSPLSIDLIPLHSALITADYREIVADSIRVLPGLVHVKKPVGIAETDAGLPEKFSLLQNYPNPFNP